MAEIRIKVLAFAASNSKNSINKRLVMYVTKLLDEDDMEVLDLNDYETHIYSEDREVVYGIPPLAYDFAKKIDGADLVIISFAEHNGAYSAAFKNLFDWASRIPGRDALGNKPVFLMATSPGARGRASVLELAKATFPYMGASILETFTLPKFHQNFDDKIGILDERLNAELKHKVRLLKTQLVSTKAYSD